MTVFVYGVNAGFRAVLAHGTARLVARNAVESVNENMRIAQVNAHLSLPAATIAKARQQAAKKGLSLSDYFTELIG